MEHQTDETEPEKSDYMQDLDTEERKKQETVEKFLTLSAALEVSANNSFRLLGLKKEQCGLDTYSILTEEENREFLDTLHLMNKLIAQSHVVLDAYIDLENSTPDFTRLLNKYFTVYKEYITKHTRTRFYQVNVIRKNRYTYPYFPLQTALDELINLLFRVSGTHIETADALKNEPQTSPPSTQRPAGAYPYGGGGGYGSYYPTYRSPTSSVDYNKSRISEPEVKKVPTDQDFGGSTDK